MNLQQARIVLRPRKAAETFDLALRWCFSVGGTLYLRLAAVLLLPAALACYALRVFGEQPWPMVWTLAVGLAMVLQGPFTIAASRLMFEPRVTARAVLRQFVSRLPAYLVALVVTRILQGIGLLVFLAWPWTWAAGAFVHEAVLLEGQGAFAGVRRSSKFVSGQYGTVLWMGMGLLCVLAMCVVAADQAGAVLFDFVLQVGRPFEALLEHGGSLTAVLGFFAAVPFMVSVRFLQYIDARTRRDGWDLQFAFLSVVVAQQAAQQAGQLGQEARR